MLGAPPHRLTKNNNSTCVKFHFFFIKKSAKIVTSLEYQNYLQLMEPEYINLSPRDAPIISSGCAKTKHTKNKKRGKKFYMPFF